MALSGLTSEAYKLLAIEGYIGDLITGSFYKQQMLLPSLKYYQSGRTAGVQRKGCIFQQLLHKKIP